MGPRQTAQITDPLQGVKASLEFVMLRCADEDKLGDRKEPSSRNFIKSHEVGVNKTFENTITCNNKRVEITKMHSPTNPSNLTFFLLIDFGLVEVPTAPVPLRGSGSRPKDNHINCGLRGRSKAHPRGS